jgi:hypothetical protein
MNELNISNVHYMVDKGCGLDIWRICGTVDGKSKCPSTPVFFDEESDVFKTISGSVYKIVSYQMNKEDFVKQIKKDLKIGFEVC